MTEEAAPSGLGSPETPKTRHLRALAFAGGAFDTIMQMGVVHALLVSRGRPPDHVVGISAGAVNAAALAEVMQEGSGKPSERLVARVRRLRAFLDTYVELPRTLVNAALPDAFEINAKRPLQPIELPIHLPEERKSRADASRSKSGLIRLMNHLLSIRVTVAAATRMTRRLLACRQADELKRPAKPADTITVNVLFLWLEAGRWAVPLSQLMTAITTGALCGRHGSFPRWVESLLPRSAELLGMPQLAERLEKTVNADAATAGQAIQRRRSRYVWSSLRYSLGVAVFVALWMLPLMVLSPPQTFVNVYNDAYPPPGIQRMDRNKIEDAAAQIAITLLQLPSSTTEAFFQNIADTWKALAVAVKAFLILCWSIILEYRVTILGLLVPFLLIAATEMFFRFRVAVPILGVWIIFVASFDALVGQPAHVDRDDSRFYLVLAVTALCGTIWKCAPILRRRLLEYYEIGDGLLSADVLRQHLVHCFDEHFYGRTSIDSIVDAALRKANVVREVETKTAKRLDKYTRGNPSIHVAPVAANIKNGTLEIVKGHVSIVDALVAATAIVPLFPAQDVDEPPPRRHLFAAIRQTLQKEKRKRTWYIDGLNVSNEPIQPLFRHLREEYAERPEDYDDLKIVDIYPVSDVPVDEPRLIQEGTYSTLVDVGLRALELKRFRDASMERRLTRIYTRSLPPDKAFHRIDCDGEERAFIRADLFPIELETPAHVNRRLFQGAAPDDYKRILRETVADGCRASLEAMVPHTVFSRQSAYDLEQWVEKLGQAASEDQPPIASPATVAAIKSMQNFPQNVIAAEATTIQMADGLHLSIQVEEKRVEEVVVDVERFAALRDIIFPRCSSVMRILLKEPGLPGGTPAAPGLAEICAHCSLKRPAKADGKADPFSARRLRVIPSRAEWPQWPPEDPDDALPQDVAAKPVVTSNDPARDEGETPDGTPRSPGSVLYEGWPEKKNRPVVTLLFGGGVFRGVFHMGVMNALCEAGIQPDLVAGSSVGSIVAAMIASAFKTTGDDRHRRITSLAATFLAIDRLVLTDRLSDFVRRFTLRGAEAHFSPNDVDRALRQFDSDSPALFNSRLRKVTAGLERLFYFSPFELIEVMRNARMQETSEMSKALIQDLQEFLERGGLGQELLGSEALSLLIRRHVLDTLSAQDDPPRFGTFRKGDQKIFFLATSTNLVRGGLEILGAPWSESSDVLLEYGLLASSAFPAVFRPRQSWEIFAQTERDDKYIDGGTIDNLPLDAVARFLTEAANAGAIQRRHPDPSHVPGEKKRSVPHLLFTASLEVNPAVHGQEPNDLRKAAKDCLALMRRAGTFKYNRKIDAYASVQRRLQSIFDTYAVQNNWEPLHLHVLAVKPNWLCSTFGLHPMLGFKRAKQAKSIAHGCASTLAALHDGSNNNPTWFAQWGANAIDFHPKGITHKEDQITLHPQPQNAKTGHCWFRTGGRLCPFSRPATIALNVRLQRDGKPKATREEIDELHQIYVECGKATTHRPME
ncbi:MAG: patatin-like phospholipase family protein [Acidobacteriota bacterium]|nr:patatin-like phospholipase family protein [Acidobacteriota bacterium]